MTEYNSTVPTDEEKALKAEELENCRCSKWYIFDVPYTSSQPQTQVDSSQCALDWILLVCLMRNIFVNRVEIWYVRFTTFVSRDQKWALSTKLPFCVVYYL